MLTFLFLLHYSPPYPILPSPNDAFSDSRIVSSTIAYLAPLFPSTSVGQEGL